MADPALMRTGLNIVSQSYGRDRISMRIYKAHLTALAVANLSIAGAMASHVASSMAGIRNALAQTQRRLRADNVNVHFDVDHFEQIEETVWTAAKHKAVAAVDEAERTLREAAVFEQHEQKVARLREDIDGMDLGKTTARAEELGYDILGEMRRRLFLVIDVDKASYFEQSSGSPFGEAVATAFPRSAQDVAAGSRCLALNEWTAAVIHLMRALEEPLQTIAKRVGVQFPVPTELENWKSIVDQIISRIDSETRTLEQQPKSHERNTELQFLGEAALQMRHFKNAWRNSVAHGRDHYGEQEAELVFRAVRDFMQKMAQVAKTPG